MTKLLSSRRCASPFVTTALALVGLLCAVRPAAAQTGTVEGRVTAPGGYPVVGAQVSVVGTNLGTRTDNEGRYTLLNLPPGSHQVRITAIGYKAAVLRVPVEAGATAT